MKTTIELSDELYRRAKAFAAIRGRKLKDVIEEGLRLVLAAPRHESRRPTLSRFGTSSGRIPISRAGMPS